MLAVEQLERVLDTQSLQLGGERLGPEVEEVLVLAPRVEVDAAHAAQGVGVPRRHPHGVEFQPAAPHLVDEPSGGNLERQQRLPRPSGIGRVDRCVAVHLERRSEAVVVEALGLRDALEEDVVGALEVVAQRSRDDRELAQVRAFEQRVAGMRRQRAEDIGPQHRDHHRAVPARRLAREAAVVPPRQRRVALVDERDDFIAEVVHVPAGAGRVQELRPTARRPGVDEHDDRGRAVAAGEHRIEPLDHGRLESRAGEPHVDLPGEPLDDVDRGHAVRPIGAGGVVDVERAPRWVAERVVREQLGFDDDAVEASLQRPIPGRPGRAVHLAQAHGSGHSWTGAFECMWSR